MTSVPDARVDQLRAQLRALGYLDAGVDRFVLGPAQDRRGPAGLAFRLALRVGVLGGLLLGPAAAIGVGARLPGLISGVRDAAVMALYLAVIFWLAVGALTFLVMIATVAFARLGAGPFDRRGPRAARAAAGITTLATLVYLTLWWRNASAGFGWSAPAWTASALVLAVAISLLLGHAQRIATLAVLASAAGPSAHLPPVGARSWRVVLAGGALAFAGAAALLIVTASEAATASATSPLTVVPTGKRLRVIAIDGFDTSLSPESAAGLRAANQGRHAEVASQDLADPARGWTTIATGTPPDVHGVHALETRRVAGLVGILSPGSGQIGRLVQSATDVVRLTRPAAASREERRVKTFWEVAADAGLRTAVVNWWATWPAAAESGIVISDRAVLRLEQGGPLDAEIAPAPLYDTLQAAWPGIRSRARDEAHLQFDGLSDDDVRRTLIRSAELDATVIGIFQALPGPPRDLDVIYLPGLDIAQHALLSGVGATPSVLAARLDALRRYYSFLDRALAPLVPQDDPSLMVMRILQPGRVSTRARGNVALTNAAEPADVLASIEPVDIAPTIAFALGVPLSRELPGAPAEFLFPAEFTRRFPPRFVERYSPPSAARGPRTGKPLDHEMIDRLRSLGYIK
ncbi:MAG TPA: alkaline phosphatase family protein [Vicinamibacterales bacterium]|nr:alkaline phosphatase family protein [Vicinamibacterales bacterium]